MKDRVVLGMVKSNLDMKGAKAPKLELDYVRLLMVVRDLRREGYDVKGYLGVTTAAIQGHVVNHWHKRYKASDDDVHVVVILDPSGRQLLDVEKLTNASANLPSPEVAEDAIATEGKKLEDRLRIKIIELEGELNEEPAERPYTCDIRWDFFGMKVAAHG